MDPSNNLHPLVETGRLCLAAWKLSGTESRISGETSRLLAVGWSNGTNKAYESVWKMSIVRESRSLKLNHNLGLERMYKYIL